MADYYNTIECPVCGTKIQEANWRDEIWGAPTLVEYHAKCPTGHWSRDMAYGAYNESVGSREWGWTHS